LKWIISLGQVPSSILLKWAISDMIKKRTFAYAYLYSPKSIPFTIIFEGRPFSAFHNPCGTGLALYDPFAFFLILWRFDGGRRFFKMDADVFSSCAAPFQSVGCPFPLSELQADQGPVISVWF
jgi:hypothetical protein